MKRLNVKFLENSKLHYSGLTHIPSDVVFKAVEYRDINGKLTGVMIRGSNLVKAGAIFTESVGKAYYFSLGLAACLADVEIV